MAKANFDLGINTGFALNRYSEPEEWIRIVADDLELGVVQMTADLLNPDLPAKYRSTQVQKINRFCERYNVKITSTFTGMFTRVNHLSHPDLEVRRHWIDWYKRFVEQSADLGAKAAGGHFGIQTLKDFNDIRSRGERRKQNIDAWHEIGEHARGFGITHLLWEPMSIGREYGETIDSAKKLQLEVNDGAPLPTKMTIDVDHGDLMSSNQDDTDPIAWIHSFRDDTAQIHLKQSSRDKRSNGPFTRQFNTNGRIHPSEILSALHSSDHSIKELILEISFREREPGDSTVVDQLKESVSHWRPFV